MKRIMTLALIGLFAAISSPLLAQDIMDKLAEASCECISKKDVDNMSMEDLQMQLGFCIMEAVGTNQEAFQAEYGDIDYTDQAAMTKLGEKIGMKMAFKCPEYIMKMAGGQAPQGAAPAPMNAKMSMEGTLTGIEGEEVATLVIKEASGRTHKLLWMDYFEGSDQLISNPKALVGKKVSVEYETAEMYSPQMKDYVERKKVTGIKVQ